MEGSRDWSKFSNSGKTVSLDSRCLSFPCNTTFHFGSFSVSNVEGVLSGEGSSIVDKGESLDRDQLPKVVESSVGLTGNGSGRGEVKRTCLHGAVSLAKGVVGTLAAFGSKEKYIMDIDESKKRTRPLDCIEGESGVRLGATGTTFALGLSSSELLIGLPMVARR
ncbi:hypothetical protein V6Z11_D02G200600 [Gossypium hirsutum]